MNGIKDNINTAVVMISWCNNDYRLKKLEQSFASFKAHTARPHLLVVIDNGLEKQTKFLKKQSIDIYYKPDVNLGVGLSRNKGMTFVDTEYIAFVDNDIGYFPNWLNSCIETLEKYPEQKLIATAVKNHPMKQAKNKDGVLDEYQLFRRCAGMCVVMKRSDIDEFGGWSKKSNCGHVFSRSASKRGYRFIWHPDWHGRHTAKASYHYKKQKFSHLTGTWETPNTV